MSPQRRQSIAVCSYKSSSSSLRSINKKRSHSIGPGETIPNAPFKAKSILKPYTGSEAGYASLDRDGAYSAVNDNPDHHKGQYMHFEDTTENLQSRALARRVSFASHAHVRVFEAPDENTNSTESPSSPLSPPSQTKESYSQGGNNDHDRQSIARLSSVSSLNGEASMSLDLDNNFSPLLFNEKSHEDRRRPMKSPESTLDSKSGSDTDNEQMDMTEALSGRFKRGSFENGLFSIANGSTQEVRKENGMSLEEATALASADFTIPLSEALHKRRPPSEAWLALQAMTHSGGSEHSKGVEEIEVDMDLTSAIVRLERARSSIIANEQEDKLSDVRDYSVDDDDDELGGDGSLSMEVADEATNLSRLLRSRSSDRTEIRDDHAYTFALSGQGFPRPESWENSPNIHDVTQDTRPSHADLRMSSPNSTTKLNTKRKLLSVEKDSDEDILHDHPLQPSKRRINNAMESMGSLSCVGSQKKTLGSLDHTVSRVDGPKDYPAYSSTITNDQNNVCFDGSSPAGIDRASRSSVLTSLSNSRYRDVQFDSDNIVEREIPKYSKSEQWDSSSLSQEENDIIHVSINNFFMMTGVKFMDELTIPRRSTAHALYNEGKLINTGSSLESTLKAVLTTIPQSETYFKVASDLQSWIEGSKKNFKQAEEDTTKLCPGLFREYVQTNDEGRSELLHQLKLIKSNNHSSARSKWYDWKFDWITNLQVCGDRGFMSLQKDNAAIGDILKAFDDVLPTLRQLRNEIDHELDEENKTIGEVRNSDPEYIEELKMTIVEQDVALEGYRADINAMRTKFQILNEKLKDSERERGIHSQLLNDAHRRLRLHKNSICNEIFKLREELEALCHLHLWRVKKVLQNTMELLYNNSYLMIMTCNKFESIQEPLQITCVKETIGLYDGLHPVLQNFALHKCQKSNNTSTVMQTIEQLDDMLASWDELQWEISLLRIKYPVKIEHKFTNENVWTGFTAVITLQFRRAKGKAIILFTFENDIIKAWPKSICTAMVDARVVYGQLRPEDLKSTILLNLANARENASYGCLLDACAEVSSKFDY